MLGGYAVKEVAKVNEGEGEGEVQGGYVSDRGEGDIRDVRPRKEVAI